MVVSVQRIKQLALLMLMLISVVLTSWAKEVDINKPIEPVEPTLQQAIASVHVVQLLSKSHYQKLTIDQEQINKVYEQYLERLDPNRSFFLATDIDEFEAYRKRMGDLLRSGNLKPAFAMFNRYLKRAEERARFMLTQLDRGINNLNLNSNETLLLDRKKARWLTNRDAQKKLWTQQLIDSVLSQKLNNKTDAEITKQLRRRNENVLRRLHQSKGEDAFGAYINAFTAIFDPHTQYFSPQNAENFDINMSLSLEGIGAVLSSEDEYTRVVSVVTGGPAERAGQLQEGDKIVGVAQGSRGEMEDVVGMRLDDVVKLIRGPKRTLVRLEVIPDGSDETNTRIYEVVRDKVKLEEQDAGSRIFEVMHDGKKHRIGVIELPTFYIDFKAAQAGDPNYKSTTRDVRKLLQQMQAQRIDGLIVDLRGNGGGSLQEANELTGLFINQGPTVVVKDSQGRLELQEDTDPAQVYSGPMVVMVDRLSASASEIFAGAMQDYGRALIVGGQSYGKGTVQSIQPLNHGQLKLTLAKFYRISGKSTQNQGVLPDINYPTLYDGREIGERYLPGAMPWDSIKPLRVRSYGNYSPLLPELQRRHDLRTQNAADFVYYRELQQFYKYYENRKQVSLNLNLRKQELQQMKTQRLAIENRLRKSQGKAPLKTMEALEEEDREKSKRKRDEREPDPFVTESGHILLDAVKAR